MPASQPFAVLLLATTAVVALLLAALTGPASAAVVRAEYGDGRMVIIRHAPGTRGVGGAADSKWRYRRVEDEVAPEFGGILATNSNGGRVSTGALDRNRSGCQSGSQCAGKAGGSYTRQCTYRGQCRGG